MLEPRSPLKRSRLGLVGVPVLTPRARLLAPRFSFRRLTPTQVTSPGQHDLVLLPGARFRIWQIAQRVCLKVLFAAGKSHTMAGESHGKTGISTSALRGNAFDSKVNRSLL